MNKMNEKMNISYELFSAKNNKIVINGVDQAEIDDIINFVRTTQLQYNFVSCICIHF